MLHYIKATAGACFSMSSITGAAPGDPVPAGRINACMFDWPCAQVRTALHAL